MRRGMWTMAVAAMLASVACDAPTKPPERSVSTSRAALSAAIPAPPNCNLQLHSNRFAHPVFPWQRTSESVYLESGTLFIDPFGGVDDGFAVPCHLTTPWELEVRARIVEGGQNYVFPKIHGQFSNGYWFIATSLPDASHGWLLMVCNPESWLQEDVVPGHTSPEICTEPRWNPAGPPSVSEGDFMTLKVVSDGALLQLFVKHANQPDYALAHEVLFNTTRLSVRRVGASQPWDAHTAVTVIRAMP